MGGGFGHFYFSDNDHSLYFKSYRKCPMVLRSGILFSPLI